ncbi:MAG TPA: AraC family transcriptional regulator [Candidatus Sulfotelmatobacter sp.]|nr:AraC family transcriptional regulator [Candidatus Sulfotelmatobacter sp.]
MDVLADILRSMRLTGSVFLESELRSQWCYVSPPPQAIMDFLSPRSEILMAFHLVTEGQCLAWMRDGGEVELSAGDMIFFPQGDSHFLAGSGQDNQRLRSIEVKCENLRSGIDVQRYGVKKEMQFDRAARVVCGFVAFEGGQGLSSLLTGMPRFLRIPRGDPLAEWLRVSMTTCLAESACVAVGSSIVVQRISELMLVEAMRYYVKEAERIKGSILLFSNDRFVQRALSLMHQDPAAPWTVEQIAKEVGLSRSALAGRFVASIGEPPMQYLGRWRISLAASALLATEDCLAQIAAKVGYESETSFNRAFKREFGIPPAAWRKQEKPMAQHERRR